MILCHDDAPKVGHHSSIRRKFGLGRWLASALLAAALWLTASPAFAQEPIKLRVLSYNIHHGAGIDGKLDLKRIADVINSVKPDLVSLQEVERNTSRTGQVDQPAELSKLTGLNAVFEKNIDFAGGYYGNAILSRFPIVEVNNHLLPNIDQGEQRGALVAKVEIADKLPLVFVATHLDHRRDDRERIKSAEFINQLAAKWEAPAILAGDLNATPESEVLKIFGQAWQRTNREVMPTVPVANPRIQIDYILVHKPGATGSEPAKSSRWKVLDVKVLDEAVASDHRAIFAELELQPPAKDSNGQR